MRNFSQIFLVAFIILSCLAGWIFYSQANCGLPGHPADAPSSESEPTSSTPESSPSEPSSPSSPSAEPSSSGPSSPKVYQPGKTWVDAVPKIPKYKD